MRQHRLRHTDGHMLPGSVTLLQHTRNLYRVGVQTLVILQRTHPPHASSQAGPAYERAACTRARRDKRVWGLCAGRARAAPCGSGARARQCSA